MMTLSGPTVSVRARLTFVPPLDPMRDATIVFDLDGTLVDTAPDLMAATNHVLASLGRPGVSEHQLRPLIGHGARFMVEHAMGPDAAKLSEAERKRLLDLFLDHYARNIAVGSRPFEGTVAALNRFRSAGARLAVCTNKAEAMSRRLLDALSLSPLFSAVAGRDTFAVYKPHPDHLLGTIKLSGGDRARAVMVGDSRIDIATAKAAGVPVVAVSFGYTDTPVRELGPDRVIDHYDELEHAIASLLR
jgi:phosphoglycolate phosphatase